jgi:hypothetical protein
VGCLNLDAGESFALLLGFNYASRSAIDEEKVVGLAMPLLHGEFTDGNSPTSGDVDGVTVLNYPSGGCQKLVDALASPIFGGDGHGKANYSGCPLSVEQNSLAGTETWVITEPATVPIARSSPSESAHIFGKPKSGMAVDKNVPV